MIAIGLISGFISPDRYKYPTRMYKFGGLAPVDWCKNCDHRYVEPSLKWDWAWAEAEYIERLIPVKKRDTEKRAKNLFALLCKCEQPQVIQKAERKVGGLPIHYNPFLKTLLTYKVGYLGFVMHKGFYRNYYDRFRAEEDMKNPTLSDDWRYQRARRKTVKLFVSHFWTAWRRINGLDVVVPYAMKEGDHNYIPPPHEDIIRFLEEDWKRRHQKTPSKAGKKVKTGKQITKRKENQN